MLSKLNIRLQNFKSYLDSGWISLDGKNVLVGIDYRGYSNGSGKSSIIDGLSLFLDNNWESYNKTEVATLTNVNTPKKQFIIVSIKCEIDGELFEASISGSDGFLFSGDKFKLAKFQQELTGAIMTQGLINNLADFDKRSQLDAYIDQFYKVQEVISKLKDFQKDTVFNLGKKIDSLNSSLNVENSSLNVLNQNHFTYKGQITLYQQYAEEDISKLNEEFSQIDYKVNSLYDDFFSKRNSLQNEKIKLTSKIAGLSNVELMKQNLERAKNDKEEFIISERTKFLSNCSRTVNTFVSQYVEKINYAYGYQYNQDVERKKKERLTKISEIETKISNLAIKTPDYVLTEKEIKDVNEAVKDWVPQEFKLGDTYRDITEGINRFSTEVRKTIEADSEEVIKLRKELENIPAVTYTKTAIQKRAEELSISSDMKKYAPVNKPQYYLYWEYSEVDNTFSFDSVLPTEFEDYQFDLNKLENILPKFSYNTSFYDNKIENLEKELNVDSFTELNALNKRITEIDNEMVDLSNRELEYQKYLNYKQELNTRIAGSKAYIELSTGIMTTSSKIQEVQKKIDDINEEKLTFIKRQEDMNKLVDSISRFSGEELRNEFGFKLAKLSSVLLNDIFNLDGEITLESNGLRTTFKYNDGNGFLSFKVLSGGQLQKIKLAINLALLLFFYKDRQYIFLDEVFQHLDNPSKGLLINYIVKELGIKNILLIQHDSLKFEGFKEIRVYRDEEKNTKVV